MLETWYFRTEPSTRTRQPLKPPASVSHAHILEIRHKPYPDGIVGIRTLQLTAALGRVINQYHRANFSQADGRAVRDVNCAHFAQTIASEGTPDCIGSIKALDALRGDIITPPYKLSLGHVGVIATTENLADPEGWNHFLHAGIGVGKEDEWLCVTGLRGDLAISTISADISYQREVILPSPSGYQHISPGSVHLYDFGSRPSTTLLL